MNEAERVLTCSTCDLIVDNYFCLEDCHTGLPGVGPGEQGRQGD